MVIPARREDAHAAAMASDTGDEIEMDSPPSAMREPVAPSLEDFLEEAVDAVRAQEAVAAGHVSALPAGDAASDGVPTPVGDVAEPNVSAEPRERQAG